MSDHHLNRHRNQDRTVTFDQVAVRQLMTTGEISPDLVRLATVSSGEQCPECDSRNTESNGGTEYRCVECDHRWGFDCGSRGEPYGF